MTAVVITALLAAAYVWGRTRARELHERDEARLAAMMRHPAGKGLEADDD